MALYVELPIDCTDFFLTWEVMVVPSKIITISIIYSTVANVLITFDMCHLLQFIHSSQ